MTRNHRRKKETRAFAAATGKTYLDAANSLNKLKAAEVPLATTLHDSLVAEFRAAGWPVIADQFPMGGRLWIYAGPATVNIGREVSAAVQRNLTGDEHPDDPNAFDLGSPLEIIVTAPRMYNYSDELQRVVGFEPREVSTNQPFTEIVTEINSLISEARHRDQSDIPERATCDICGDRYPSDGLFEARDMLDSRLEVCPCCIFDADIDLDPALLAYDLDFAATESVAAPAGWAAAQVLLGCLGGADLLGWLKQQWKERSPGWRVPEEWWADSLQTWIWLPPAAQRPIALADLGCGASLNAIIAAVGRSFPELQSTCRVSFMESVRDELVSDSYGDFDGDSGPAEYREMYRMAGVAFERLWPAAVAFTVAMATQVAERPRDHSPRARLQRPLFQAEHWDRSMSSGLNVCDVESVLEHCIPKVREALYPDRQPRRP
ncbi:hypothetical protein ACIHAX_15775 [Nocardia sp. NPDC051929]|uniref:hypothetical protein n=1 Tax=Nocardia sp. NPDC051929 TaxID=3364327 RepID=UPI0037C74B06